MQSKRGRGPLAGLIAPAVETTDGADMQPLVHAGAGRHDVS